MLNPAYCLHCFTLPCPCLPALLPSCPLALLPACSDPSKLEALNLNPGVPRVDEQTRREFEQFKAREAASKRCARCWLAL